LADRLKKSSHAGYSELATAMTLVDGGDAAMRRGWVALIAVLVAASGIAWFGVPALGRARMPIKVGILHSLSGPMAISEQSMKDAEVLALEEINAAGGLLGRQVVWEIADGKSDPATFAREAERLIAEEKVSVLFGCWTSATRKSVKAVVERAGHLLIYPVAYEGLEQSPNIIYCGAAPNQQIIPTVKWSRDVLKAKTYFLIGTDSIWPRSVNTIIKDQLTALGAGLLGEEYIDSAGNGLDAACEKALKAGPDVIMLTIEGDANLPFYKKMRSAGGAALKIPIITFPVAEDELQHLPVKDMVNDYLVCNYFQAIDRPENRAFITAFRARFGQDRVTSDSIDTAWNSVRFWAQGVRDADSVDVGAVRASIVRQSLNAPEGVISIDRESQHTYRPFFVGKVRADGQVEILYSVTKPIRPVPFPFSRTRQEWEAFLDGLYTNWDRNWAPPATRRGS
jgi:urea transport system substrate-binding protein